jgi:hypothetical protein
MRCTLLFVFCCGSVLGLSGCTGLEPAVIGAAVSGTQAGAAVYSKGRISAAAIAHYPDVQKAVRAAAAELSFDLTYERENEIWSRYTLKDDRNKAFSVYVRVRTETMTQLDIDVGRFGNAAIGRLLLMRVGAQIPQSGLDKLVGDSGTGIMTDTGS